VDRSHIPLGSGGYWLLLALLVIVLGAATLEGLVRSFWLKLPYDWRAYRASLGDALLRRLVDAATITLTLPVVAWAYRHRLTTIEIGSAASVATLFIAQEFFYYWYHRCSHRVRWFWATHAVHHSPNELTLAAALRLGWTAKLTGMGAFFAPVVWMGFAPLTVVGAVAINLTYQFWLHATWIPKLGPLEWVLNTPSHHRVHHGSNVEYLDCNYGGVLIIFDRLFGTFVEERDDVPVRFGLTTPLTSYNPLFISLHAWIALARDVAAAPGVMQRIKVLLGPPGR
jgi:sterol desaturase/sphingolipid hydroxylase (fatty acid hydroxylase superfamily)